MTQKSFSLMFFFSILEVYFIAKRKKIELSSKSNVEKTRTIFKNMYIVYQNIFVSQLHLICTLSESNIFISFILKKNYKISNKKIGEKCPTSQIKFFFHKKHHLTQLFLKSIRDTLTRVMLRWTETLQTQYNLDINTYCLRKSNNPCC